MLPRRAQALLGVNETVEPHVRRARQEAVRVERGEDDKVEALMRSAEERTGVVEHRRDSRGVERPLRMVLLAESKDERIDLDRRDVLRAAA